MKRFVFFVSILGFMVLFFGEVLALEPVFKEIAPQRIICIEERKTSWGVFTLNPGFAFKSPIDANAVFVLNEGNWKITLEKRQIVSENGSYEIIKHIEISTDKKPLRGEFRIFFQLFDIDDNGIGYYIIAWDVDKKIFLDEKLKPLPKN